MMYMHYLIWNEGGNEGTERGGGGEGGENEGTERGWGRGLGRKGGTCEWD